GCWVLLGSDGGGDGESCVIEMDEWSGRKSYSAFGRENRTRVNSILKRAMTGASPRFPFLPRRNARAPSRFGFEDYVVYALQVVEDVESLELDTYREAITSKDSDMWIMAMGEEIESLHKNKTWELVQLLERRKVGYSQKEGIDYNEIFFPVVRHTSIRVLLSLVAHHDLELEELDVKTVFLHGELKE
nr:copia LTR rider [Tanacetum cinerariifolium]